MRSAPQQLTRQGRRTSWARGQCPAAAQTLSLSDQEVGAAQGDSDMGRDRGVLLCLPVTGAWQLRMTPRPSRALPSPCHALRP